MRFTADEIRQKIANGEDKTDWASIDAQSENEVLQSIKDDSDWADFVDIDWSDAKFVYPISKSAISIRIDDDVISFFKAAGKGYQSRINAVLRHFMIEQERKKKVD